MSNPYSSLPDHQFWRRAVAGVERFRFDPVVRTRFKITPQDRVATAGSCFAQHISSRLAAIGFNYFVTEAGDELEPAERRQLGYGVFSARFGNIYTSRQLLQLLRACTSGAEAPTVAWQRQDGRYVDALRPQITPEGYASADDVAKARQPHLEATARMFRECDVFVFTFGLTETWRDRRSGQVYPLAPGVAGGAFDPEQHEFVNLGIDEVVQDMEAFLQALRQLNPGVKVILTVSPVPLVATYEDRNVLVATTYSKSVLRVAADMLYRRHADWVEYFPSYEIITGNYNNNAYYEADCRGINRIGVDHAMRCFLAHFTEAGAPDAAPPSDTGGGYGPSPAASDIVCDEEAIDQVNI